MGLLDFVGDIASVIGQGYQSRLEARVQKENVDKTIQANRQLAEYQYSKDLEMWNRGNLYNAPEAQMERLKKAGLNPNLVYGSGAVAGQTAGSLPKYQAPTVRYDYRPDKNIPAMLSNFQDYQLKDAQIDNLRAQRRIIEAEGMLKGSEAKYAEEIALNAMNNGFYESQLKKQRYIWGDQELKSMFYLDEAKNKWFIKPEMKDQFVEMVVSKWNKPVMELQKFNADIARTNAQRDLIEQQTKIAKSMPWLNSIIKLIGVFK